MKQVLDKQSDDNNSDKDPTFCFVCETEHKEAGLMSECMHHQVKKQKVFL